MAWSRSRRRPPRPHDLHNVLVRSLGRIVDELGPDGPTAEDRNDLQRALYGLDAILRLHMAQEEELYASIDAEASSALVPRPA